MKNENVLILALLAVIGFLFWQSRKPATAAIKTQTAPQSVPVQQGPPAPDYIAAARTTIDWVADKFGGWGGDEKLPS